MCITAGRKRQQRKCECSTCLRHSLVPSAWFRNRPRGSSPRPPSWKHREKGGCWPDQRHWDESRQLVTLATEQSPDSQGTTLLMIWGQIKVLFLGFGIRNWREKVDLFAAIYYGIWGWAGTLTVRFKSHKLILHLKHWKIGAQVSHLLNH